MSDSISTPASAPAPAPAVIPSSAPETSAPPPASQPSISLSEAGRLLNQQRRNQQPPQAEPARPRGSGEQAPHAAVPRETPAAAATPPTAATPDTALDTMARALGLPEGLQPHAPADSTPAESSPGIEVDGRRLSADEVRRAVSMSTDYTQKTQALAAQQRALAEQQQALATVLPYLQPELARIAQQIQGVPRPDASLIETNPQEYLRQMAAHQAAQQEQGRLGELTQLQQQAQQRSLAEQVARGNEAMAAEYPQWNDPATRQSWQTSIAEWAMDKGGFQREELSRLADHRQLKILMKAMMFDNLRNGTTTSAPVQSRPVRGVAPAPKPAQAITAASDAFDARPSLRNATALLSARRANGG